MMRLESFQLGALGAKNSPVWPTLIFLSAIFWMPSTVDYIGWSVAEVLSVYLLILLLLQNRNIRRPSRDFIIPLLALALWAAAALFWSCNFHATLTGLGKIFFILIILVIFCNDTENWERAVRLVAIVLSGCAAAIFLLARPTPFLWTRNPNLCGGFMALGGILSVGTALCSTGRQRCFLLITNLSIGISLFLMGSLGPLLSWIFGCAVQYYFLDRKKIRSFGILIALLFSATLVPAERNLFRHLWLRRSADAYAWERAQIWQDALGYFSQHPILGTGLGTFRDVYPQYKKIAGFRNAPYAHNEAIHLLCEMGVIGALILFWLAGKFAAVLRASAQGTADPAGTAERRRLWLAVTIGALLHSLVDFNLRYLPILVLFVFSVAMQLPRRETEIFGPRKKWCAIIFLFIGGIIFSLPGAAWFVFNQPETEPARIRERAVWAARIDPFNGLYHAETGRMRDLLIAIDLEPRNVWHRRKAAEFYQSQWERSGMQSGDLDAALEQYEAILKFAPGVIQFQQEYEKLLAARI